MNEQMYELLAQARNQPVDVVKRAPHGSAILTPVQLEKFAELIVRECAAEADKQTIYCRGIPWGKWIKEHFGVEE
jgi:hypothetical protein